VIHVEKDGGITMPHEFQRTAHLSEIRRTAQEKIFNNIYADSGVSSEELLTLAQVVSEACAQCIRIIPGPTKGQARAREKTAWDYRGDFYDLKDVVRMTIIADNKAVLRRARQALATYCMASNGYGVIKNDETLPIQDPCGYSGLNFVAKLPNGRSGEIQANIPNIMFGKMSREKFCRFIDPGLHARIQASHGIECGMGHGLYEIYRSNMGGAAKAAAALSKKYYDFLREAPPNSRNREALNSELASIKREFRQVFR
jgi:hypothetical protein